MNESYLKAAISLVAAVAAALRGDPVDAARNAADALLEVYPVDAAKQVIDDASVRRANIAYFIEETAKFGPEKP